MTTTFLKSIRDAVKFWYIPLIIGILFLGIGIWVLTTPIKSYLGLSVLFSISFFVSGVFEVFFSISNRKTMDSWGWSLAMGILNLVIGVLLLSTPSISIITLPLYVGFVLLFRGLMAISLSYELKDYGIIDWGNLLAIGILSTIFAIILLWNPLLAGMTIVIWTALAFLTMGGFSIYFSFRLKKLNDLPKIAEQSLN